MFRADSGSHSVFERGVIVMSIRERFNGRPVVTAMMVVIVLVAASCGSGDSSTSGSGGVAGSDPTTTASGDSQGSATTVAGDSSSTKDSKACELLTVEDLNTITGYEFGDGTVSEGLSTDGRHVCDWITTGSEFATAQTMIVDNQSADDFNTGKAAASDVFTLVDVTIPGADLAYATEEGSLLAMLIGDTFLQVGFIPGGPGSVLDETEQLAALAAGRL